MPEYASSAERHGRLLCFWPGQAAADKGLDIVRRLASTVSTEAQQLCVVADESARIEAVPGGSAIRLLKKGMPREDYSGWLRAIDVALVPSKPESYANRTSGIFGDAIALGKPPVVTAGTWMAHELRRFGLGELVLDWGAPDIIGTLLRLPSDQAMLAKLAVLTQAYADFHSRRGYARVIRSVYQDAKPPQTVARAQE